MKNVKMLLMPKFTTKSHEDIRRVAQEFLKKLTPDTKATVVALKGDLGSGKTTFTQALGQCLGVRENMHSPTFVILKIYRIEHKGFKNLIHIDAYRLEKEDELSSLGWEDFLKEPENLVLVEWPENVKGLIPDDARKISFEHGGDEFTREVEIDA